MEGPLNRKVFGEVADLEARGIEHFEDLMLLRDCLTRQGAYTHVALCEKKIVALASGHSLVNGGFILKGFVVEKPMRYRGLGSALVERFAKDVKSWYHGPIFCCVRDDNSALGVQKTLRRAHFRVVKSHILPEYFKDEPTDFFEMRFFSRRS